MNLIRNVKSVFTFFSGIKGEIYYEIGKDGVIKIEEFQYSPADRCNNYAYDIYFENGEIRRLYQTTEVCYLSEDRKEQE